VFHVWGRSGQKISTLADDDDDNNDDDEALYPAIKGAELNV
jgi:hypothetical protein